MARKPDIQYIGQFYNYGSEARQPERKPVKKQAKTTLPEAIPQKKIVIGVDPVALVGMVVAVVMVILMVVSTLQYVQATEAYEAMEDHVYNLREVNISTTQRYHDALDLEYVESTALALGMIPVSEAEVMTVNVTVPVSQPERTVWDNIKWFFDGLLA